jgi:hypothetical protein
MDGEGGDGRRPVAGESRVSLVGLVDRGRGIEGVMKHGKKSQPSQKEVERRCSQGRLISGGVRCGIRASGDGQ